MAVRLDHTIVPAHDKEASAVFLAHILGLEVRNDPYGYFAPVELDDGTTLDFLDSDDFRWHHYAFLVSEEEFDAAYARMVAAGIAHYADPHNRRMREISYTASGARSVYFDDPNGHIMEFMTAPDSGDPNEEQWTGPFRPASER
jgi:catechol 2,3-dioxygenase-like lactoylglutathione lyase family enzyme